MVRPHVLSLANARLVIDEDVVEAILATALILREASNLVVGLTLAVASSLPLIGDIER